MNCTSIVVVKSFFIFGKIPIQPGDKRIVSLCRGSSPKHVWECFDLNFFHSILLELIKYCNIRN